MSALNYTTRRNFLKTIGLGAMTLTTPRLIFGAEKPPRKPNVLLYVTDDQGTDDAGCYGNGVIKTPGLDTLARFGTRFTNAFCTTSSCSPSRSVILSGLYNHANGMYGLQHSYHHFASFSNVKTLPVLLADAGYRTARIGKYHLAPEQVYRFQQTIEYKRRTSPEKMADNCSSFISEKDTRPFFLYFCTHEPHRPFVRKGSDVVNPKDVIVPPYLPDTPQCREELAHYYASVQRADKGLYRLIEILKETGRWEDTVIIYVSDNGIAFPGAKTTLYEPGIRLPFVVRNPYAEAKSAATNAMVSYVDITPTILDFAGALPQNHKFHGRSFKAVLDGQSSKAFDEVYASHTFHEVTMYYPMRLVRTRRYKLIWNIAHRLDYPFASDLWKSKTWQAFLKSGKKYYGKRSIDAYLHRPRFELYDLKTDPYEITNLADDQKHAQILKELKAKLKAFQIRTKDPWLIKWERD